MSEEGQRECRALADYYLNNARIIKSGLQEVGYVCFGGENAPYVWLKTPKGVDSWTFFDRLLNEAHVVGTPGAGFGSCGEGYLRLSAFGRTEDVERAVESIRRTLPQT